MAAYLDDKTKKWFCTFKYKDWTGKTRKTTKRGFARKKDALAYEMDFKNQSQSQPDITVSMLAEKYLADYKINRKESSYYSVKTRIIKYIINDLGNMLITDITPYVIKEWQNNLQTLNISQSLIRSVNVSFSAMLNYGIKFFNLQHNPFTKTGKTGKIRKKVDFWELTEFQKADELFQTNIYDRVIYNLLFWSGMRIGEVEGLTLSDIDFINNIISISHTYNHNLRILTPPKTTSSIRKITMPAGVMQLIQDYFNMLLEIPEYPFSLHSPIIMRSHLKKYAIKAGLKVITLHDLRHSHASYLIQQGVAITAISRRLGHSSPAITLNTYAHCYKDNEAEIAEILEKDFKRTSKGLQKRI